MAAQNDEKALQISSEERPDNTRQTGLSRGEGRHTLDWD